MAFDTETFEESTRKEKLRLLQAQVNEIFAKAISNKTTLEVFALEIWVNTVQEKAPYVAIASRMINLATGLAQDENLEFLRFLAKETLAKNVGKSQWAVQLIYNGLVINNRSESHGNTNNLRLPGISSRANMPQHEVCQT
ncbi:hypothetical protein QUA81_13105 [Microcoleus sp. F6_B4]